MSTTRAVVVLEAIDRMTSVVDRAVTGAQRRLEGFGRAADRFGRSALMGAAAIGAPLALGARTAMDFEQQMANVSTIVDTNVESMEAMGKQVLALSAMPVKIADLTSALYDVRSAGIESGRAMNVLETSARLSVAGLSTTKEATDIMTSALNAFSSEGLSAAQTADIVFKTVKAGKTTVSQLAESFGSVAPVIQSAGVQLADFQAATAALTTVGVPASQAQTQLRAAVSSLLKPSGEMAKILDHLGVKSGPELIATSGGLGGAFKAITETADKMGVNLAEAVGRVEALNAVQAISGTLSGKYLETLQDMTTGTDALTAAYEKQASTNSSKFQVFQNQLQRVGITVGNLLLPALTSLMDKINGLFTWITSLAERFPGLSRVVVIATGAVAGLLGVLGVVGVVAGAVARGWATMLSLVKLLTAGYIRNTVAAVANKAATIAHTVAMYGMTTALTIAEGAQWAWNAAMAANPIGAIIALITGLTAIIISLAGAWDDVIGAMGTALDWIWQRLKDFAGFFAGAWRGILSAWEGLVSGFRSIFDRIGQVFTDIVNFIASVPGRMFEAGKNIINSLVDGMTSVVMAPINFIGGVVQDIIDFLPFSPAKKGPMRNIMKVRIVESIAETMDPTPAVTAMEKVTQQVTARMEPMITPAEGPRPSVMAAPAAPGSGPAQVAEQRSGAPAPASSVQVLFSPTINVTGGGDTAGNVADALEKQLRKMGPLIGRIVEEQIDRSIRASLG